MNGPEELRERLILLRVHMGRSDEQWADAEQQWSTLTRYPNPEVARGMGEVSNNQATAPRPAVPREPSGDVQQPQGLMATFFRLDPMLKYVAFELVVRRQLRAKWRVHAADLDVPVSPDGLAAIFGRVVSSYSSLLVKGGSILSGYLPQRYASVLAEELRKRFSAGLALPERLLNDIRSGLAAAGLGGEPLWFEIEDPAGYLPALGWEQLLRPAVSTPIVRLPPHTVDPISTHTSLDVLFTCSGANNTASVSPKAVLDIANAIMKAVPDGRRCMIHMFVDASYHGPLAKLLGGAAGTQAGTAEPYNQRGIILYELPSGPCFSSVRMTAVTGDAEGRGAAEQQWYGDAAAHPWASWIQERLGMRAIDLHYIIADGELSPESSRLVVAEVPNRPLFHPSTDTSGTPLRFLTAHDLCDMIMRFGGWATIVASASEDVRRAHRMVMHELVRLKPGVYAVHEIDGRTPMDSLTALCEMLISDGPIPPPLQDISVYCHPDRILGATMTTERGDRDVVIALDGVRQAVRAAMDLPLATPQWLAASQRYLETTASQYLSTQPQTVIDQAAKEGVGNAMLFMSNVLAKMSENYVTTAHTEGSVTSVAEKERVSLI
jgi:hypothetical protein